MLTKKILVALGFVLGLLLFWLLIFWWRYEAPQPAKATLEFWSVFEKSTDLKPLLAQFEERTGVRVNFRSFTDLQEYQQTLLLELAAGEGPDVFALHYFWLPKYRNLLKPLPSEQLDFDAEDVREIFLDAVAEAVLEGEEDDDDEDEENEPEILALPLYLDSLALFYYKPLFQAVLTKPYAQPGKTWQEVQTEAIKLTVWDPKTGLARAGLALGRVDNITRGRDLLLNLYLQLGGRDLANFAQETARDDAGQTFVPLLGALDFGTSFARNSRQKEFMWNARLALTPEKELLEFAQGRVAMIAGYSYYFEKIKSSIAQLQRQNRRTIDFAEVEVAPLPQFTPERQVVLADFFALTVAKNSQEPEYAWQLILDLTGRETQKSYHAATKRVSGRRDLNEEQQAEQGLGVFAKQAVFAKTLFFADFAKTLGAFDQVVDQIADGKVSVAQGLNLLRGGNIREE